MKQRTLKEECQNERRKFKKIGQKYYHIENNEKLSWFSALQRCAEWGGHLVHLKSDEEWNLVKEKLEMGYRYWVDLNDLQTDNTFMSATTGEEAKFVKWHSGEPGPDNNEHCVELGRFDGFDMNDFYCFEKKNFICESSNEREELGECAGMQEDLWLKYQKSTGHSRELIMII
ncbi:uncharacterized protein Dwil_GK27901 [Drosophila willistoni]|uniref:C-type lectin domain-containing protein n=1 Tax=Drosophila willistoni TaxID=7260 RepID=A0A0Q9X0U7_DROWI|nr:uncharacterized protein Dwil_GK27901 [Drosophila willistoni]